MEEVKNEAVVETVELNTEEEQEELFQNLNEEAQSELSETEKESGKNE